MEFCRTEIINAGLNPDHVNTLDYYLDDGTPVHQAAYLLLRTRIQEYCVAGILPKVGLAHKPGNAYGWSIPTDADIPEVDVDGDENMEYEGGVESINDIDGLEYEDAEWLAEETYRQLIYDGGEDEE